ncbi:MAG: hypothetical protein OXK79_01015, partial [Chloroflexota bacterium]|nr:hypothetical protein [Chloroflexota bacterium]
RRGGGSPRPGSVYRQVWWGFGGTWLVACADSKWLLCEDELRKTLAHLTIDEIDAWKLFTKSTIRDDVEPKVAVEGDTPLALKALETVSIIA